MIVLYQDQVAGFAGGHVYYWLPFQLHGGGFIGITTEIVVPEGSTYHQVIRRRRRA